MSDLEQYQVKTRERGESQDFHQIETDRVSKFKKSFELNESKVRKFKRRRKRITLLDRVGLLTGAIGVLAIFIFSHYESSNPEAATAFAVITLGGLGTFVLSSLISFIHSIATWHSDISSEMVSGYEINQALHEFEKEEGRDISRIIHHLEQASDFLSLVKRHKLIASNMAEGVSEYVSQIVKAEDQNKVLLNTFPEVVTIVSSSFAFPDKTQIDQITSNIQADPTYTPDRWTAIKQDVISFGEFFVGGEEGIFITAVIFGVGVGYSFGIWRGATVFFGIFGIYSVFRDRIAR